MYPHNYHKLEEILFYDISHGFIWYMVSLQEHNTRMLIIRLIIQREKSEFIIYWHLLNRY